MIKVTNRIFDYVLGLFLVLVPIVFVPFNNGLLNGWVAKFQFYQFGFFNVSDASSIAFLFMELGILSLFALSLFVNPIRKFNDYYVAILFFLCLLGMLLSPIGLIVFSTIFLSFLFYYIVYTRISSYKTIIYPIVIVSTLNTVFAILQTLGHQRADGLMFLSNHMAFYQALATPICYLLNPWFSLIPMVGLALSGSYVPLVAMLIGMSYLTYKKFNLISLPFMGIYSAISIYLLLNWKLLLYKIGVRMLVWKETFDFTSFGHPFRQFNVVLPYIGQANTTYSLYLSIFYYLGLIGILIFLSMLSRIFYTYSESKELFIKRCFFSSFLIILLCGLSQSFIDYSRTLIPAISVMILLNIILTKESEVSNGSN